RRGKIAGNDPWDGRTLEWSTTSPPPAHDFDVQPVVSSLDAFWAQKHPESLHVEPVDPKEGLKYDPHGIHIPGQSWYPFLASLALFFGCYALMFDNFLLAAILGFGFMFTIYGWAFEGVGGSYIKVDRS